MLTSCDIFSPAATTACTRSAERKQSGYCVPLGWPAPILRAPTPPTMTTRGIDVHCRCIRASAILWSLQVVPRPFLIYPWSCVWWPKMISCLISVFVEESSQLWSCWCKIIIHNCLWMLRLRALCVADVGCMWTGCWGNFWPAPDCFYVDVLVYVPMYIIPTAVCVWFLVLSCYWQLLIAHLYNGISDALLWAAQ